MPTEDQIDLLCRFYNEVVDDQGHPPLRQHMMDITGIRDEKALDIALRIVEYRRAVERERIQKAMRNVGRLELRLK